MIDEYPIREIPPTRLWSENFALAGVDPSCNVSVFYSVGRWYADPTLWRENIVITLPNGEILFARNYGRNANEQGPGAGCSHFQIVEPGKRMRLSYDGPIWRSTSEKLLEFGMTPAPSGRCQLALDFVGTTPIWNMKGDSAEASSMAGGLHIEQIGSASATIRTDHEQLALHNFYAVRDHSRGVRDPSGYRQHSWVNGSFPGGRSFFVYGMRLHGHDAAGMGNAAIIQDGVCHQAKLIHTDYIDGAADARKLHLVIIHSPLGEMEIRVTEVLTSLPMSFVNPFDPMPGTALGRRQSTMFDEGVRLDWQGSPGIGWSERGVAEEPL